MQESQCAITAETTSATGCRIEHIADASKKGIASPLKHRAFMPLATHQTDCDIEPVALPQSQLSVVLPMLILQESVQVLPLP
jgi:hypothetical protein